VDLEKTLLRKVGEAVHRFKMVRDGDRVAVALSGGKDSATLLEALLLLQKRAPISFSVCAFTVEQGKFLRPIEPLGQYLKERGVPWTYFRDNPSLRLLEDQPDHGCDLCSRYRRRAVYEIAHGLGANVIAFGHTADDFCEALLRNTMFTWQTEFLLPPPVTFSRNREYRLIRPPVSSPKITTRAYAEALGRAGGCWIAKLFAAHRYRAAALREVFAELAKEHRISERICLAMGNVDTGGLLDALPDLGPDPDSELFPIVTRNASLN
jgi:tRNA 2-thiocytidine biosynthesis protein TtcA